MADSQVNQDEFIDLYEALDLPQNADIEKIRKRINALYLESQQNLDHRNARKRLHYQQLYEIILPQARHLLLDGGRRGEYDRYLTAFKTGTKVATTTHETEERRVSSAKPATVTERLKEEEGVDPEKLAEQREDMWAQWKHGLEQIVDEPTPTEATEANPGAPKADISSPAPAARIAAPQPTRAPELRRATLPGEENASHGFSSAALHAGESSRLSPDAKRLQDQQRIKIIEKKANNAMLPQGLVVGLIVLAVSSVVLYFGTNYLTSNGILTGIIGEVINLGWIPLAIAIAFIQGRNAAMSARQNTIDKLSRLSFEELKRRYGK
jgi:hypothetical protein